MAHWIKREGTTPEGKAWAFSAFAHPEYANFLEEMFTQSDRTLVIISCAYIDDLLRSVLDKFFVENDSVKSALLDPLKNGALAEFAPRADVAFLLGLISSDVRQQMRVLAKIRNRFAHDHRIRSFEDLAKDEKVKKEVEKLKRYADRFIISSEGDVSTILGDKIRPRYWAYFTTLQAALISAMHRAEEQRRGECRDEPISPAKAKDI